ncbi:hypothetical protein LUZ60_012676 [Juncus effusus]|nr:hypothetical protein LUZ60_012676 [Juncus effusus]
MSIFRAISQRAIRSHRLIQRHFLSNTTTNNSAIDELNKEMEEIFGQPPPNSLNPTPTPPNPLNPNPDSNPSPQSDPQLTHTDISGKAKMVNISQKPDSTRVALASCKVLLNQTVFNLVSTNQISKGDVLTVAKLAGIMGAKNTSNLIPLCHNINLSEIRVELRLNERDLSVEIEGEVNCEGKTGVEMEALTAVSVAGLTVYDMCKAVSKEICITDVCLVRKSGGKSGNWSRGK